MGVQVKTDNNLVVTITIVNKQNRAIVLCKETDETFHIDHYDLKTMEKIESVKGMVIFGDYIKGNTIAQNKNGDVFSLCYIDNGVFHLRIFDHETMIQDFNINEMFGIIDDTVSIPGFF